MKKIEVLHCHGSGILPTLIGFFSKSYYTHSAIRVIEEGETYIYEAQANGVNRKMFKAWVEKYGYKYDVTAHEIENYQYSKMLSKQGVTSYDYRSLLVSQPIYLITGWWIGSRGASSTKEMYCSEYCAWVLGFPKWWTISPKSLHKLCTDEKK